VGNCRECAPLGVEGVSPEEYRELIDDAIWVLQTLGHDHPDVVRQVVTASIILVCEVIGDNPDADPINTILQILGLEKVTAAP
jgi:hypothetical protein